MLVSLYIENFGLVDRLELELSSGLNVLTGETGAGKTILAEALQVSLGGRPRTDLIRTGRDRALVQSSFEIGDNKPLARQLEEYGLIDGDNGADLLILTRELHRQGRNICRVNGRPVNLGVFQELAGDLVDLQGQHEQHSLLAQAKQLLLLDRYGGASLTSLAELTGQAFRAWSTAVAKRDAISSGNRERQQRADTLMFQIKEIDAAALAEENETALQQKRNRLANGEKIALLAQSILEKIYQGTNHHPAAVDLLGEASQHLAELCRLVPELQTGLDNLHSALYQVEETAREVAACRESMEIDPAELNFIEDRLALIERLKKKYADSLADILAYRAQAEAELEALREVETDAATIQGQVLEKEKAYHDSADQTSRLREETARQLEKEIKNQLEELVMPQVNFTIELTKGEPSASGNDKIQFLFSPNRGEPLRPLAKTASGGELSRVMLAIRTILALAEDTATIVFDEIDAGIGGQTIHAVAEKLAQLSNQKQIICITHSAVVAACAATHYLVQKESLADRTVTGVQKLTGAARVKELNRMLGGDEHAELLAGYINKILK
ncbi:MAG: DNA repair protein RecN [Firmicutes bacterium]|nr:DNA repair protein RecN [Bacillota bacterium]